MSTEQPWPHRIAGQLLAGDQPHCPDHLRDQVGAHLKMAVHVTASAICSESLIGQREKLIKESPVLIREHVRLRVARML